MALDLNLNKLVPLIYVKIHFCLKGENIMKFGICLDAYIRSMFRHLHSIFHKFSTELWPLIYGVSLF